MNRLGGLLALILLFGGGWLLLDGGAAFGGLSGNPDNPSSTSPDPSPTDQASDDPSPDDPEGESGDGSPGDGKESCSPNRVVADFLREQGFSKRQFVIGADEVNWQRGSTAHTDQAFSSRLRTEAAVDKFVEGRSAASVAARGLIGDDAVIGGDWVAVQFQVPVAYSGNWRWDGMQAVAGGDLMVLAGDIWWMNVYQGCEVDSSDSIRAACGNVGFDTLQPMARKG